MFITKRGLDQYVVKKEVLLEEHLYKKKSTEIGVFLSHKHNEKDILYKVVTMLKSFDVNVYLDWQDNNMPCITNGTTALLIKKKIEENKKFIFLATEGALDSKWCNWELGYGDSHKYDRNIAIMPIAENDGRWPHNEYLQIYPYIDLVSTEYYVKFKDYTVKLSDWFLR